MQDLGLTLAEECFQEHVQLPSFRQGVERGWWDLVENPQVKWPHVLFWIEAGSSRTPPARFFLRFELNGYPDVGPTAAIWDIAADALAPAGARPKGSENVKIAFRTDWENGRALYVPWDRIAWSGHALDWQQKYKSTSWKPTDTIAHYLRLTHELLTSDDYGTE